MPSRLVRAIRELMAHIEQASGRVNTILNGKGEPGHRAVPARGTVHDENIGCRIDFGETTVKEGVEYRRFKLQINKNANNSTLKKMAAQDPHRVWSTADVEVKEDRTEEEKKEAILDVGKQLENNVVE